MSAPHYMQFHPPEDRLHSSPVFAPLRPWPSTAPAPRRRPRRLALPENRRIRAQLMELGMRYDSYDVLNGFRGILL